MPAWRRHTTALSRCQRLLQSQSRWSAGSSRGTPVPSPSMVTRVGLADMARFDGTASFAILRLMARYRGLVLRFCNDSVGNGGSLGSRYKRGWGFSAASKVRRPIRIADEDSSQSARTPHLPTPLRHTDVSAHVCYLAIRPSLVGRIMEISALKSGDQITTSAS